jgi:hypothetical protein
LGLFLAAPLAFAAPRAVLVEPPRIQAGEVEPGEVHKFEWTLRNDGDAPLLIEALESTCYCTTAKADASQVAPGASTKIRVAIDPSDFTGTIHKGFELETNDPRTPKLAAGVEMVVRPGIAVVPPALDFGTVPPAGSQDKTIDLKSAKTRPFQVTSAHAEAPFVAVEKEPMQTEDRAGYRLYVQVKPGAPAGPFATRIVVETDDAAKPRIEIPVRGAGAGGLRADPARLVFEAAAPGSEVGRVRVLGGKAVQVTGVKCSTPMLEAAFAAQPDGSCEVRVRLAAGAKPGRILGKVIVATGDAAQPEVSVPVMGVVR